MPRCCTYTEISTVTLIKKWGVVDAVEWLQHTIGTSYYYLDTLNRKTRGPSREALTERLTTVRPLGPAGFCGLQWCVLSADVGQQGTACGTASTSAQ